MEIIIDNFKIKKLKEVMFFDLSELITVNAGKDSERQEYQVISYGIPFESCIKQIVDHQLRNIEGEFTLKEFVELYDEKVREIAKHFE